MDPTDSALIGRRRPELTSFALHLLAMAFMLCDHVWAAFPIGQQWPAFVGRVAFPLFAFLLTEGFFHTRSRKRYAGRLLVFALISELPFNLFMADAVFYPLHQNVLWAFLLGLGMLCVYEKIRLRRHLVHRLVLYALTTVGFYGLAFVLFVDYYGYGIATISLFYFTRKLRSGTTFRRVLGMLLQTSGMYWIHCELVGGLMIPVSLFGHTLELPQQGFALLALPLIWLYCGRQGYSSPWLRWLYYGFYPAHMALLVLMMKMV